MGVTVDPQAGRPRLWVWRKGHPEPLAVYTYVCLPDTVDPRGAEGQVNNPDARLWHPWLRINRVLRVMLQTRWSAEAWSQVRVEFKRALTLRS